MSADGYKTTDFAEAIAWLASNENKDAELRAQAIHVLDALSYYEYLRRNGIGTPLSPSSSKPDGGARTTAETAEATAAPVVHDGKR